MYNYTVYDERDKTKRSNIIATFRMGKNTTSGHGDDLSFGGTINHPTWSGDWEY